MSSYFRLNLNLPFEFIFVFLQILLLVVGLIDIHTHALAQPCMAHACARHALVWLMYITSTTCTASPSNLAFISFPANHRSNGYAQPFFSFFYSFSYRCIVQVEPVQPRQPFRPSQASTCSTRTHAGEAVSPADGTLYFFVFVFPHVQKRQHQKLQSRSPCLYQAPRLSLRSLFPSLTASTNPN